MEPFTHFCNTLENVEKKHILQQIYLNTALRWNAVKKESRDVQWLILLRHCSNAWMGPAVWNQAWAVSVQTMVSSHTGCPMITTSPGMRGLQPTGMAANPAGAVDGVFDWKSAGQAIHEVSCPTYEYVSMPSIACFTGEHVLVCTLLNGWLQQWVLIHIRFGIPNWAEKRKGKEKASSQVIKKAK